MRVYEFGGIDIQTEIIRLHNRQSGSLTTNESTQYDAEYIESFIISADDSSILESDLEVGKYYFPIDVMCNLSERKVTMTLSIYPAKFIGLAGSRLEFRYDACTKSLFFPQDEFLVEDEHRFVYSLKDELDYVVTMAIMKFRNTTWDFYAIGFDKQGVAQRITNI